MFELFRRDNRMLGIDISATTVKLLELSRSDSGFRVESYAVTPLSKGAVVEKTIKDSEAVTEGLRTTVSRSGAHTKPATVAVADSSVITKVLQMDGSLSEDELEEQITIEADKYIPYPLEEVRLDFDIISPSAKNERMLDVLLVASRSENVNARVEVVKNAGMDVKVVDVESYAMERACALLCDELPNEGKDKIVAIIDIGATMTNLTVLYNMSTVFTREEVFGGQRLTEEIQQRYDLSFSEAGYAKKVGNLPDDYENEVLTPFIETAVLQVRRSLQFFYSASQHSSVDHILLAGGTVQIPGLCQLIEEQVGVPTTIANPFSNMAVAKNIDLRWLSNDAPALMICCGLALRGFAS